jgi:hypothetical protein
VPADVSAEHLPSPSAFQANDPIMLDRTPYRHGWRQLFFGRFPNSRKGLMYCRDQGSHLIGSDLVAAHVGGDDFRREFSIQRSWIAVRRASMFSPFANSEAYSINDPDG